MADDFDNTDEIENLSDGELRQLVIDHIRDEPMLSGDAIKVHAQSGKVTVSGKVGTEEELRILDHFLTDSVGISDLTNNVVIDELYRARSPEASDEQPVDEEDQEILSDKAKPFGLESELADSPAVQSLEDPGGTHDVGKAIEDGEPWIPPEGPTPEGLSGLQDEGTFGHDTQH